MKDLDVLIIDPQEVIFEGKAKNVILPGEMGVFEILPRHKKIISRLLTGTISIDDKSFDIKRGLVTFADGKVTILVEEMV